MLSFGSRRNSSNNDKSSISDDETAIEVRNWFYVVSNIINDYAMICEGLDKIHAVCSGIRELILVIY